MAEALAADGTETSLGAGGLYRSTADERVDRKRIFAKRAVFGGSFETIGDRSGWLSSIGHGTFRRLRSEFQHL